MREFVKMHALGNDFAIFDGRTAPFSPEAALIRRLADRRRGIGFDQLVLLERGARAEARLRFFNADGSESGACGNATRCVARLLHDRGAAQTLALETAAGTLCCRVEPEGRVTVAMPEPRFLWDEIPLAEPCDTLALPLSLPGLPAPAAVNVGNPHAVFFVEELDELDVAALGARVEHHPLFPERTNVGFAQIAGDGVLRLRVFERGVGVTPACGTAACAAVAVAVRRGLVREAARVILDGGVLEIRWPGRGAVEMTGPASYSYLGTLHADLLSAA